MGFEVYMQDILRNVSSALLVPVMVILAAFCVYALYCVGSIITEAILQRRHYRENIPAFINSIEAAPAQDVAKVIQESGMLEPHKRVLLEVAQNMGLSATDLYALAAREEELLEEHYGAVTARTDQVAKLAPMFGLMGTLIPLGPGIVALGIGDTETLSSSLLVAFDTTVAGLASGAVCSVVGRIRKSWYKKYTDAVHAAMTSILDKAQTYRTGEPVAAVMPKANRAPEPAPQPAAVTGPRQSAWNAEWERRLSDASLMAPTQEWAPITPLTVRPTPEPEPASTGSSSSMTSVGAGLPAQHPEPAPEPTDDSPLAGEPVTAPESVAAVMPKANRAPEPTSEPEPTPEPEPTDDSLLAPESVAAVMPKANRAPEPTPEPETLTLTFDTGFSLPDRRA